MTLTLNKKAVLGCLVLLSFVSLVAGNHGSPISGSSGDGLPEGYSIPEYGSQGEMLMELVAPFIAIAVLLQFVFFKVLVFTLAEDDSSPFSSRKSEIAKARKQSMVLSLVITAMMVPSPYWSWIRKAFQGITFAAIIGLSIGLLILVHLALSSSDDGDGE
jgi:uncharacterized membrane protein